MTGRVLLVRPVGVDRDADVLVALGAEVTADAYITVRACTDDGIAARVDDVLAAITDRVDWLVTTSRAAPEALVVVASAERVAASVAAGTRRGMRCAAVGPTAAAALEVIGATNVLVPQQHDAIGLLAALSTVPPASVIVPEGNLARPNLRDGLADLGWSVETRTVYDTASVIDRPATADALARGDFDVVVLRSPSAARAVAHFVPVLPAGVVAVCGGSTTAAAARDSGFATIVVSTAPTAQSVAEAVAHALEGSTA